MQKCFETGKRNNCYILKLRMEIYKKKKRVYILYEREEDIFS